MIRIILILLIALSPLTAWTQSTKLIPYRKGSLWGYANENGQIVIPPKYERTYFFSSDGLARIKSNNMYGYMDAQGKVVIVPKYSSASDFYMGIAKVEQKKKTFCINLEDEPDECNPEEEQDAAPDDEFQFFQTFQGEDGKLRLIATQAEDTVADSFDKVSIVNRYFFPQVSHFAIVEKGGLKGAYNELGILVAPVEYAKLDILDMDSYKATKKDSKWGVRGFQGEDVLPFAYDSIVKVTEILFLESAIQKNDHYIVGKDKKFGIVNRKNQEILKLVYDEIKIPKPCACPTEYVVRQGDLYGLMDFKGQQILPTKYAQLEPFYSSNITLVKSADGKEGYINRNGREYFSE